MIKGIIEFQLDEYLENISKKHGFELIKSVSTWYNGHAYHPLEKFILTGRYDMCELVINYEFRHSEFSKSKIINEGADIHSASLQLKFNKSLKAPDISIEEKTLFQKLFNAKHKPFKIKTPDNKLKTELENITSLNNIFNIIQTSADLSPSIYGKTNKKTGEYILYINFQTQYKVEGFLDEVINFCNDFITLLRNSINYENII